MNVLALALGLHVVGLGLTTDSRGMGYTDDLIDESDSCFLSFSRRLAVIPYFPHKFMRKRVKRCP